MKLISQSDCGSLETFNFRDKTKVKSGAKYTVYSSNDGTLTCMIFEMTHSGDVRMDGYDEKDGTVKYFPADYFEIYPPKEGEKGRERLFEIIKEQELADDFPIMCKTKEEAIEILKKILG